MAVVARFYVSQITRHAYNPDHVQVTLNAVGRGPENKVWASATPAATCTMTVNNGEAGKWFADLLGKDIAVRFDVADAVDA